MAKKPITGTETLEELTRPFRQKWGLTLDEFFETLSPEQLAQIERAVEKRLKELNTH